MNFRKSKCLTVLALVLSASSVNAGDDAGTTGGAPARYMHYSYTSAISSQFSLANPLGTGLMTGLGVNTTPAYSLSTITSSQPGLSVPRTSRASLLSSPDLGSLRDSHGVPFFLSPLSPQYNRYSSFWLSDDKAVEVLEHDVSKVKVNEASTELESSVAEDFSQRECTENPTGESLTKLAQETDWTKCYDGRLSYASGGKHTEKQMLTRDQDICKCLRDSKLDAVKQVMGMKLSDNAAVKASLSREEKFREIPGQELNNVLNGILFQAISITNNPEKSSSIANNLYTKSSGEQLSRSLGFEKDIESTFTVNSELLSDKVPYPSGQCLSPREFILARQRPDENVKSLIKGGYKNPDDWDYKKLQEKYNFIMKKSYADRKDFSSEIAQLKSRLVFLNRNPMIKYALGSDGSGTGKSPQEIAAFKNNIVKALKPLEDSKCDSIFSQCSKDYNAALDVAFSNDAVITMIRREARRDHVQKSRRQLGLDRTDKSEVTQRSIVAQFTENFKLKSPDHCEANDSEHSIQCLYIYSAYCKTLDKYKDDIATMNSDLKDPVLFDNIDDLIADDFNTDYETNEDFRSLNDAVCNKQRKSKNGKLASFSQFVDDYCKSPAPDACLKKSAKDYASLKKEWMTQYPEDDRGLSFRQSPQERLAKGMGAGVASLLQSLGNGESQPEVKVSNASVNNDKSDGDLAKQAATSSNRGPSAMDGRMADIVKDEQKPFLSGFAQGMSDVASNMSGSQSAQQDNSYDSGMGYSNSYISPVTPTQAAASTQNPEQKVESMPESRRQELLEDWQKEYESWKKSKGNGEMSPADVAKDSAMKQEIATLRALLAQQQQLSEQQYKLLNDAIAAKGNTGEAQARPEETPRRQPPQFASAGARPIQEDERDVSRGPASVKENKLNTSGANGGGAESRSSSSNRKSSSGDNSDSVAREEAKLVNMRRFSDGSITIEPSGNGSAGTVNAITVPVSDEQYRMLQANPTSLNLSQIERSIPKDQIAKLEKSGEITILLRNGSNPPFEVKVEKKENRLVYSLKDKNGREQAPVRRVFTRQALELQLKAQQ